MNGKKAKALRRLVNNAAGTLPEVSYSKMNDRQKVYVDPINKSFRFNYTTATVYMEACVRRLYQKAKKAHYRYGRGESLA